MVVQPANVQKWPSSHRFGQRSSCRSGRGGSSLTYTILADESARVAGNNNHLEISHMKKSRETNWRGLALHQAFKTHQEVARERSRMWAEILKHRRACWACPRESKVRSFRALLSTL
jgi:hypothetical protein